MLHFWEKIVRFLNHEEIPYMLSGSMAMSVYTLNRSTQDFDFIVNLKPSDITKFLDSFKTEYYCSEDAIKDALIRKSMFNIIDPSTGFKADFIILKDTIYRTTEFNRRRKVQILNTDVYVVSGEDLLISKLIWIQELQSGRQMEDIKAIAGNTELDWNYIWYWIQQMELKTFDLIPKQ